MRRLIWLALTVVVIGAGCAGNAPLQVATNSLPSAVVQQSYSVKLTAFGGVPPLRWSILSGRLPSGMTLSVDTGNISGIPISSGDFDFTVGVTSTQIAPPQSTAGVASTQTGAPLTANKQLRLKVNPKGNQTSLVISTTTLPSGTVQVPYTAALAATGGTQPYSWSVIAGSLPPGLALGGSTGAVAGTPSASGQYSFTVQVTDSAALSQNATMALALTISPSPALSVSISPLTATVGSGGTQQFTATVLNTANTAVVWSVAGGGTISPSGLYMAPAVTANAVATVTATSVADGTKSASATVAITVASTKIATSLTLVPNVNPVNQGAWLSLTAHVAYPGSSRPTGLITISEGSTVWNGGLTPVLDETWWTNILPAGTHSLVAKYSGDANYAASVSPVQVVSVAALAPSPLQITTSSLPGGQVQASYSATLAGTGGTPPYSWGVVAGSLPPGLALGGSNGVIAGASSSSGQYSFTVQATDSASPSQNATKAFNISIAAPASTPLQITTASLPGGAVGVNYSATLVAANGVPPYTWSTIGGLLPPGLALQASTGQISGNPTQVGAFGFLVQAKDSSGQAASSNFNVTIAPVSAPTLGSVSPNSGPAAGGTSVAISGTNFQVGATVSFGGVAALSTTISSATRIQAVTPAHAAGTVDVVVQNPDLQTSTLSGGFVYNSIPPTLSSVSPNSAPAAGGTSVSISGTNFLAGALVLFGTAPASGVTVNSATQIQAITAANTAGAVDVTVQNPDGQSGKLASGFTYTAPPVGNPSIASISPNSGPSGTQVTINGTNFGSGATVTFGGTNAASTLFVSATQLTASVPAIATGVVDVKVTNPGGASGTLASGFTVVTPQSFLAGMTPGNFTVPSGWTLVLTQDFESGSVPGGQTVSGNITTTNPHTGSKSDQMFISYDQASVGWTLEQGNIGSFSDVYLSFYELLDSNAAVNDEMAIADLDVHDSNNVLQQELYISRWGFSFNTTAPNLMIVPQSGGAGVTQAFYGPTPNIGAGSWHQWEIWWHPNTPGSLNGFVRMFRDGQLVHSVLNANLNASVSMNNARVWLGGYYTKLIWKDPSTGTCTPLGTGFGNPGNGQSFAAIGAICPPTAPSFNRYIDDIILLKKP